MVGLKRRGVARADMHALRRAYRALFFGPGTFRARVEEVGAQFAGHALVERVIAFIREGGTRALTMAVNRAATGEPAASASA